jgi:cell division protein WhiA
MSKTAASPPMQQVVAELLDAAARTDAAGRAEAVTLLRVGGGVRVERGRVWLEATLPSAAVARRLAGMMVDFYDCAPTTTSNTPNGSVHLWQCRGADLVARRAGLLDARGRPVQGMPAALVTAAGACPEIAAAAVRGTVLASGRITGQRGSIALHARCDGLAAAMAVAGFTRRLGAEATLREHRGGREAPCSVLVRDFKGLHPLLVAIGHQYLPMN